MKQLNYIKEFDAEAKVIIVTSHGEEKSIIQALSLGAKGYILKPIDEEKLKTILIKLKILN